MSGSAFWMSPRCGSCNDSGKIWKESAIVRRVASFPCLAVVGWLLGACSEGADQTVILAPDLPGVAQGTPAFLGFPERAENWADSPRLLSETLGFSDVRALQPSPGLLPYGVQSPLFSDGASKQRWLALPGGSKIGFSESGAWTFPEGTVFVKEFDMALDERHPEELTRLETRFLVAGIGGDFYGLSYVWNAEQTDAELRREGHDERLEIVGADGTRRVQTYSFPAQSDCARCHSDIAGGALGPRTAQLNGEFEYTDSAGGPFTANQLATWGQLGLFDRAVAAGSSSGYPRLANLSDESQPVERRIRSYWDSNCSMCHNAESPVPSWDARYATKLENQGVLNVESYAGPRSDGLRLITPGDPDRSLMVLRAA
ncbi:MAG TPA: hypothetical protein VG963_29770, partial [Polyangiaceae bacterium]|nr:hypothetical protein [Polyangiaceae bacterium]